ncbi:homocysteine S-methyltransferase family protein [Anaerotruncus colihominis]|uniref:homocysteine S-methyltransferase family protein n=1 Tax=Anaerotruncus colihominis TaxID=169435 RepID=UPI0021FB2D56|nr:homocysteine S-methyltransferase family protein [Anaerotruncus colihominis]UWN74054.1 homocysteine S-methyltransferase family protein [Anaerotruncus colihominis]
MHFDRPFLFDGAFGTYYFSKTGDEAPCELANLTAPQTVLDIHREYAASGCAALKTNTFAANPVSIPDSVRLNEVIAAGWSLAQRAAQENGARVFADIGGICADTAEADYLTVVRHFLELGAQNFLFETLACYQDVQRAVGLIRQSVPDATVIVSFAVSQDGYSRRGLYCRALFDQAESDPQVDAVGLNCSCGPSHMRSLLRALGQRVKPVAAMPNAGYPSSLNGRVFFEDNAGYFAQQLSALYMDGADILGGCCGTTPQHIRCAAAALAAASELRACGVDLITVTDSPLSRTRADSLMTAAKIRREAGIEVMPHISCRDKNHIALRAGLLGAAFEGIGRVLIVTGDPPMQAGTRGSDGVYHLSSYDLIAWIHSMNSEVFADAPFLIGGALNVNAANFDAELARAKKKLSLGASMLFTQPIFSDKAVDHFLRARQELKDCRLFAGILPVAGYKNALFLINEVSGIEIPDNVVRSLEGKTPDEAAAISVAYSAGIMRRVYDAADGFYIMTPLKKVNIVRGLIEEIRRYEQ